MRKGNVWIAGGPDPLTGNGARPPARPGGRCGTRRRERRHRAAGRARPEVLATGKFLLQIGKAGKTGGNDSKTALNRPAASTSMPPANEVYVADGFGNRRVVVFDADDRRLQAALGRIRREAGRGRSGPTIPTNRPRSSFEP